MLPMDLPPQEPQHTIDARCDDHNRKALGLMYGLGVSGAVVVSGIPI